MGTTRQRILLGLVAAVLVVVAAAVVLHGGGSSDKEASVRSGAGHRHESDTSVATTTDATAPTTTSSTETPVAGTPTSSTTSAPVTTTTLAAPETVRMGTASLTFSGVLSGPLMDAVARCDSRPTHGSQLTVDGTLGGTPWVVMVQSYTGEAGVWQVLTGAAGGPTGMLGQGYATTATHPATVGGVTQVDWGHGATLDVELTSRADQTPAGTVEVKGTITCDR